MNVTAQNPTVDDSGPPADRILRFRRSERLLHWSIAIPFMVCFGSALILVVLYNPDPQRSFRAAFSWAHRLSGICLIVFPPLVLLCYRADYRIHLDNIRQGWVWVLDDLKWLMLSGLAAVSSKVRLPEQGKFNAAEKLNFMMVMSTYPLFILTGVLIWLPGVALYAWLLHFAMAVVVVPLMVGHIFMATVNPSTRVGLSGMISGFVDRGWARHHYRRWYRERFEQPVLARDRVPDGRAGVVPQPPVSVRCPACHTSHELASWSGRFREILEADSLNCRACGSEMGVVTVLTAPQDVASILRQLESVTDPQAAAASRHVDLSGRRGDPVRREDGSSSPI